MKERDYLWCLLQMMLDEEETLAQLCPTCRQRAEALHCPACGQGSALWTGEENDAFDMGRFLTLKGGSV